MFLLHVDGTNHGKGVSFCLLLSGKRNLGKGKEEQVHDI